MDCFKNFVTKFINEATEEFDKLGFDNEDSANVFYYIGRLISNKGPQTNGAIEKYLDTKAVNKTEMIIFLIVFNPHPCFLL